MEPQQSADCGRVRRLLRRLAAHHERTMRIFDPVGEGEVPMSADYVAVWLGPFGLLQCKVCGALVLPEPDSERDRHGDYHQYIKDRFGHLSEPPGGWNRDEEGVR